jgi:hypothetical protein
MATRFISLGLSILLLCARTPPASAESVRTFAFQFITTGPSPAVFVSASGEGCCDFAAELQGGFTLHHDTSTGIAWLDDVDATLTSAVTLRLGVPVTDTSNLFYSLGPEWLNGKAIGDRIPGFLSSVAGYAENSSTFRFGPGVEGDHRWRYTISTNGPNGALNGESLFLGDDGDSYDVSAALVSVVPEPSVYILIVSLFGGLLVFNRRRRLRVRSRLLVPCH